MICGHSTHNRKDVHAHMATLPVMPRLTTNLFLDHVLKLRRGPDGVELDPRDCMGSGDGYIHFSIVTTVGEEAAWQVLGEEHAVPASVNVLLCRPAEVRKGIIIGTGEIVRAGANVMHCKGIVTQDMKTICEVAVTFTRFVKRLT